MFRPLMLAIYRLYMDLSCSCTTDTAYVVSVVQLLHKSKYNLKMASISERNM